MSVKGFQFEGSNTIHKYDYEYLENKPTTDDTLTQQGQAADAKKVGDEITNLKSGLSAEANININSLWARCLIGNGTSATQIGTTGKQFEPSTTRISIKPVIKSDSYSSVKFIPESGYKYYLFAFDADLTTIVIDSGWQTEEKEYQLSKGYISVTIAKADNSTINVDSYDKLVIQATVKDGRIAEIEDAIDEFSASNVYADDVLFDKQTSFGRYTIGTAGTTVRFESSTTRIATHPVVPKTSDVYHIIPSEGYKYILYTLADEETFSPSYTTQAVWQTNEQIINVPDSITHVILVIAKTDNSTITTEDYDKVTVIGRFDLQSMLDDIQTRLKAEEPALPDYWQTYFEEKKTSLCDADMSLGFNGVSFAFITDIHVNTNNKISPAVLKYITTHTNVRDVVCGGDIITNYNTKANALKELYWWTENTGELSIVNIHGNHDGNSNNQTDNTQIISNAEFYALECKQSENYVNYEDGTLYGYRDNEHQKVRFIYLDTGAPDSAVISDVQISWMQNKISELSSGWTVIVFAHQFWTGTTYSTATLSLDANGTKILNALNDIYDSIDAVIACVVVGHCHRNYSMISEKGFPIIATTCDTGQTGSSTYDPDTRYRTAGTTDEQVIDLYYINISSRDINIMRIGAGDSLQNRQFTY